MFRNFLKWFHFLHKSVSTHCLFRTLFRKDICFDNASQIGLRPKNLLP